jgi:hypothetical protein
MAHLTWLRLAKGLRINYIRTINLSLLKNGVKQANFSSFFLVVCQVSRLSFHTDWAICNIGGAPKPKLSKGVVLYHMTKIRTQDLICDRCLNFPVTDMIQNVPYVRTHVTEKSIAKGMWLCSTPGERQYDFAIFLQLVFSDET